jgi:hypothetical protein
MIPACISARGLNSFYQGMRNFLDSCFVRSYTGVNGPEWRLSASARATNDEQKETSHGKKGQENGQESPEEGQIT